MALLLLLPVVSQHTLVNARWQIALDIYNKTPPGAEAVEHATATTEIIVRPAAGERKSPGMLMFSQPAKARAYDTCSAAACSVVWCVHTVHCVSAHACGVAWCRVYMVHRVLVHVVVGLHHRG